MALASDENAQPADNPCRSAHCRAHLPALDLAPRRDRIYSPWTSRQFRDSRAGEHGRPDHSPGIARRAVVALLRRDGDGGLGAGFFPDVPIRTKGRREGTRKETFREKTKEDFPDIRTVGIFGHCNSRIVAAADSAGAVCTGGRSDAVFGEKIFVGYHARADRALFDSGLSGEQVWKEDVAVFDGACLLGFGDHVGVNGRWGGCVFFVWAKHREEEIGAVETPRGDQ